ncbi:TonB-dependent receptor [Colwellia sp. UCD-KL20]|uniref:TonB-dependent receptor plug domain-containing protein n=1 Tax=Colwellia sp. UCD-KL20 TaxID=1917165 RepID=UPI000970F82B|nr:TonB-dependent receptor [Colwellia sp. UCD-KL20]
MFTHKTNLHKLTLLSVIIVGSITTIQTYAFTPEKSIEENLKDRNTEVITVEGRRNQALTELTPETEKLLSIAGLDHDPLSAVYSMPGVVYAGGDDGGAPAIRGSSPDDNAFYIDDLPSGYIFHLFGDSIFNENVVRDFRLEPAAFGSHYGNATGGVFDVKLRDPRNQDISTTLDMSLLKASVMVEGGIADNHAFYLAYRRSLIHLFLPEGEEDEGYTIFKAPMSDDYQGKYQWLIGDKHKLTFTITGASDVGGINISEASEAGRVDPDSIGDLKIKTQFDSQSASWQYYGDNQKIMHFTVGHTTEKEKQSFGQGQFINIDSEIYNARFLYQIDWFESHKLITGVDFKQEDTEYSYDTIPYYCTDHDNDCESRKGDRIQDTDALTNKNIAAYIHDQWTITDSLMLDIGLRAEHDDYTDQKFVHPRVALHWYATNNLTFNTKVGTYSRFPDVDTALRKIGNPEIKPPKATHYAFGFEYNLNGIWQTSLDIYYKDLNDMARSTNESEINKALHYTNDLSGSAKGIEWVVRREKQNAWYGWASISWSKSDRTDDITNITTEYYLDTPLLANLVANYELNERWDFGVKLSIRSGQKYTPIIGLYENPDYNGHYLPQYGELNSKTLPVYHRLDIQANYKTTYFGNKAEWSFAMLNALGSDNISGYYYAPDGTETLTDYTIEGEKGMEMFPSIGLKMQF